MELKEVKSSNIEKIGHDEETQELQIQYKGGSIYAYDSVPAEIHAKVLGDGTGIGGRVSTLIKKGGYKFRKIK